MKSLRSIINKIVKDKGNTTGMIQAGALPYAIIISLLILSFCSILILLNLLNIKTYLRELQDRRLNDNIESAFNYALAQPELFNYNETVRLPLFDDSTDVAFITLSKWGAYDLLKIRSKNLNKTINRAALLGDEFDKKAIYLSNQNDYLYIAGNMQIIGDCWIPGGFVKSGTVEGRQFTGNKTVQGKENKSENKLPEISSVLIDTYKMNSDESKSTDSILPYEQVKLNRVIKNSFANKPLRIYSDSDIQLSNIHISGNILIKTLGKVEIDSSCHLQDIIVYASSVKVNRSFTGSLQILSKDSIVIDENCTLIYPSFIATIGSSQKQKIVINKGATVHGGVMLFQTGTNVDSKSKILLRKGSQCNGVVYSNTKIELLGKVYGSVYTNEFTLNTGSSVYKNFLYDAYINSTDLNKYFASPSMYNVSSKKVVVGWLY